MLGVLEEEAASGLGNVLLLSWLRGWGVGACVVTPVLVSDPCPVVLDFTAPVAFVSGAVCVQGGSSQWLTWHISSQASRVLRQLTPVSAHFGK